MAGWSERRRIMVGKVGIDYVEGGAGDTLLVLHSGTSPVWPSSEYLDELARSYRVIAPWHPGFGGSDLPRSFTGVSDLAYLVLDLIDEMQLRDVTLVGASFGGWIASEVAVRCTARLRGLVLSGPFGIKTGPRQERDIVDFYAVPQDEWPRLAFCDAARWTPEYSSLSPELLLEIARGRETTALFGWSPFMHNPRLKDWLHRINVPTCVVWGELDRIIGRNYVQSYADEIRGARLVCIDGAGHYPHIERPAQFAECVRTLADRARTEIVR